MANKVETTISITNLSTGYRSGRSVVAVSSNLTGSLRSGELVTLLGPNGSGKSTLLRTMASFQPPIEGGINLFGKDIARYSTPELSKTIGVVLTDRLPLANLSVMEVVALGRSPYTGFFGHLSAADNAIVERAMELVGIYGLRNRPGYTLSDGERQKMMIAKALAQQTPIVLLDEPTAFLDYPSKVEIMMLLRRLAHTQSLTVFMSTHDLEIALRLSDSVWLLDRKHGLRTGVPEDLSLDGSISTYFDSEGVSYDAGRMSFRLKFDAGKTISVVGAPSPRRSLLVRALERSGYTVGESRKSVEVTPDAFLYDGQRFAAIGSLLDSLRD